MKAPRLSEVTARVVAWHNRHPLARRIDPTQVHSIGEVRLPFASASPLGAAVAGAAGTPAPAAPAAAQHGPSLAEALAQRSARHAPAPAADAGGIEGLDVQSMLPEAAAEPPAPPPAPAATAAAAPDEIDLALDAPAPPASGGAPDDDGDGEAALVIPLLDGDDEQAEPTAADTAANPTADTPARADAPVDLSDLADAMAAAAASPPAAAAADVDLDALASAAAAAPSGPGLAGGHPPPQGGVPSSALARAVERRAAARAAVTPTQEAGPTAVGAPPPGRWRRLLDTLVLALRGRQPGLPPLRAAFSRDFIWPLRPGQVARWAQRHGQPQPVAPADWPQRSIDTDRARLAALRQKGLAHELPLHVLTAAIGVGDRRIRVLLAADGSVLGPRAYSRPRVGAAATLLAIGLVGAGWSLRPLQGPGAGGGGAALAALAASAPADAASQAAPAPLAASSPAPSPADAASATALADAASAGSVAASSPLAAASAADSGEGSSAAAAATQAASQAQADIRPMLSDDDKHAARVEAARLRGEAPPAPPADAIPGPVYAVVSLPSRQREAAAGNLVLMQSAATRLSGPAPTHGELLQSQGQWRAAWWPFASLVDAERARVLLAGRGLKAEVIEF